MQCISSRPILDYRQIARGMTMMLLLTPVAHATTPGQMAELSLEEILSLPTDKFGLTALDYDQPIEPWQFSMLFSRLTLRGYQQGSKSLSDEQVQFSPGETRTNENFPILPTIIDQDIALFTLSYAISHADNLIIALPLIRQSTEHRSIVANYPEFTIDSQGLGDFTLSYRTRIKHWDNQDLGVSIGFSAPTGSINEAGDTPRDPGDQQLPYTMQLGSGTWDFPLSLYYHNRQGESKWGLNLQAKIRTGRNDRDYRIGDRASVSGWWRGSSLFSSRIQPIMKLGYHYSGKIKGQDRELLVSGNFPYPAGITNPRFYGGKTVHFSLGLAYHPKRISTLSNYGFSVEVGKPLYQSLNGVQPKQHLQLSVQWHLNY